MNTRLREAVLPTVHTSVVAMLEHTAKEFPERLALVMGEEQFNYRQLRNAVVGLARVLVAGGSQGQRVATVLPNSLVACIAPYAIAAAGAQHVPLNPQYTARELQYMLKDSAPHILIVEDSLLDKVHPLSNGLTDCTLMPASHIRQQLASWRENAMSLSTKGLCVFTCVTWPITNPAFSSAAREAGIGA